MQDLEGSSRDLIDVLFRHLREVTEEKQERSQNKRPSSRNLNTRRPNNKLCEFNVLNPTGYVMHHQFNIQRLYALPTLYLRVLYLSENKQRLVPLTA